MPPAALLIHGFTATPECMESLAKPLKTAGFNVRAPLLPGHGTKPEELLNTTWQDWYGAVLEEFDLLKKKSARVCVAGLSLGGLLALHLASERPVDHLALLATPIFFEGFLSRVILPLLAKTPLHDLYRYQKKWMGAAISDPWGKRYFRSYDEMPIRSIWEIVRLQKVVRKELASLRPPTLIIHSPHDITAPFGSMKFLKKHLGSPVVQTKTLEKSNHVLTMDYERNLVANEVVNFFAPLPAARHEPMLVKEGRGRS